MPPRRRARYEDEPFTGTASPEVVIEEDERRSPRRRVLTAATAGRAGLRHIADMTAKEPEAVTLVQPVENGWVVDVEVVEDHRIPSSSDIIALYEAEMDDEGTLLSYRRTRRYRRGAGDCGDGR
ncbi:gas vesicle protein GvpO [Microbispora sp. NPDC049125]|uniref:gas vesicle protein GvpO n=1 Tax=Microbispora sp. NPDC049125 TaxID=3154929 RepID=UPI003467D48E